MSAIIEAFGVDWRLLIINAVNFALTLGVLWYFLYAPLMRIIEERRAKVAAGVRDAEAATEHLRQIDASRSDLLASAGKEADEVLAKAREAGVVKQRELAAAGEATAARLLSEAQLQAREAREHALEESKKEVAKLIVLGIEKAGAEK